MYWTDPHAHIPSRTLLDLRWRGGVRHGNESTRKEQDYDRWWRQRIAEIVK